MPIERPDAVADGSGLATYLFVDRIDDSEALTKSLQAHLGRVRSDAIDPKSNENVLAFYGKGGMGKTKLSQRLEKWLNGELGDDAEWGLSPVEEAATVRWDFDPTGGNLGLVDMMHALRIGLGKAKVRTPAFDLVLAAYLNGVNPKHAVDLLNKPDTSTVFGVLESLGTELGVSDLLSSVGAGLIQKIVDKAIRTYTTHRELGRFPTLGSLLERCRSIPADDPSPEIVIDLAWLLTEEIGTMSANKRPTLVIFIDTFEKVQHHGNIKNEVNLCRLMLHLPYALFVITGRERVTWYKVTDSPHRGPRWWPSLVPGRSVEPRQHLLGRLSDIDRDALIKQRRDMGGWPISDAELAIAAERTDGYPLHVDAVCQRADNLTHDGAKEVFADDIGRDLPELVRRLMTDLSEEQARAFQAACLLPFFDVDLAAAVGQISRGGSSTVHPQVSHRTAPFAALPEQGSRRDQSACEKSWFRRARWVARCRLAGGGTSGIGRSEKTLRGCV